MLSVAALSGCAGKGSNGGGEPSVADAAANEYDRAVGNSGFRVTGSLTGTATALNGGAVSVDILDVADADSGDPQDKADFLLEAHETGFDVGAQLKAMATGAGAGQVADHYGGVGRNVQVFGASGVGPKELPQTTAYLFGAGFANIKIGDEATQSRRLVYIAVTQGLRDASGAPLVAPDDKNLQLHVIFPGSTMTGSAAIEGIDDGFLYYYFESVGLEKLDEGKRNEIGKDLSAPPKANLPPVASGVVLVDAKDSSNATQEQSGIANVTVTFDGSGSSDPDGGVQRWVWRIFELTNNTGTYDKPKENSVVQGEKVQYNFTKAGPKLINLTVADAQGASHTKVISFWVDFHSRVPGTGSIHSQAPIASESCRDSVNCFKHSSTILPGFVSATYTVHENGTGTMLSGVHIDFYKPGEDVGAGTPIKSAEDEPLVVTAEDLAGVTGTYNIRVWYETGASVGGSDDTPETITDGIYDFESSVRYTPAV